MKQQEISQSQLKEVVEMVVKHKGVINIDEDDVRYVLVGKAGSMYTACQGDENCQEFLQRSFQELMEQPAVKECKYVLLNVGMSPEEPLLMEDMNIINEFMGSFSNNDVEFKWGLYHQEEGQKMALYVICTNDL